MTNENQNRAMTDESTRSYHADWIVCIIERRANMTDPVEIHYATLAIKRHVRRLFND